MTSRYRLSLLSLLTTLGLAALSLMGLVALLSHPAPLDANDLAPTPTLTAEDFVLQAGIACQISGDAGLPPCHADFVADSIPPSQFGVESEVECRSGLASFYPCRNIDLVALLPLSTFESGQLNDIWGWTDPETGAEIVIIGAELGTVFVDISNPSEPIFLGQLPNTSTARRSFWKDVKTYQNYAYVVADFAGQFGMQVFDLTKLRGEGTAPQTFSADFVYDQFGSAHNIMINADTGFAYAVGVSSGQEICNMGMHVVDLNSNPLEPTFAGCVDEDGYVHDTQCVVYFGPDALYQGREICFNFNEDDLVIVDVTEKDSPVQLSKVTYVGARYTHQGWLTPDQSYLLLDDESDERADFINTTTYLWDVTDLTAPQQIGLHRASTRASDHNQYERWGYTFQANYQAGLRILDLARIDEGELTEVAYFDTFPTGDASNYNGAWSSYPYFESGIVAVSGIEQGLFLLRPTSLSLQRFDVNEMSEVKAFPGSVVTHSIELLSLGEVDTYTVDIETGVWTTTLVSDLTISGSQFDRLPILVQV
ncbi:MAG: choice-of-anchor B family protein, partial [Chloroflexota bacterium]